MAKNSGNDSSKVDNDAIKRSLRGMESPKVKRERERVALFHDLYEDIRDQLIAGVSKSAIIKVLAEHGFSISGKVFDDLLEDEAKRRGEPVPGVDTDASGDSDLVDGPQGMSQVGALKQETE